MEIKKLKIDRDIFDINLAFYNFLKKVTQSKLTENQINDLLIVYLSNADKETEILKELLYNYIDENINRADTSSIYDLVSEIETTTVRLFIFALKLNLIKDLLLGEAKIAQNIKAQELQGLNQLSLAYDKISTQVAYATRISGALLSLLFFERLENNDTHFISEDSIGFIKSIIDDYSELTKFGLEPNQIFMLLFSESINQSITSSAGASYEDRIKSILIGMGIPKDDILKTHDGVDSSTEFDFLFVLDDKSFGIGAKRTLRERYKQFIKTGYMSPLDVMIEVTLGTDLRENIAKSIRQHGVYLFVADEVYEQKPFLKEIEGVYPTSALTMDLLIKLPKKDHEKSSNSS